MQDQHTIPPSRRAFIAAAARMAGIGAFLFPLQKVVGNFPTTHQQTAVGYRDQLVLNRDTNVVHLPSNRLFMYVPDILIRRMQIIPFDKWETMVKAPIHFCKERSGLILERLAFRKLAHGITNASLSAAANTISLAFTPVYKTRTGEFINRYNFRLHDLMAQCVAFNTTIPLSGKWDAFQKAIGHQYYLLPPMKSGKIHDIPARMHWLKKKENFDKQIRHIVDAKTVLTARLLKRAAYPQF